MKLNLTVVLTLILLTLMLGAGYMSAIWGFAIGHEALKGVTQPDTRPTTKIKLRQPTSQAQKTPLMLKEEDILTTVKMRTEGKGKKVKVQKPQPQNKQTSKNTSNQKLQLVAQDTPQAGFPITSKNQKVTIAVSSARYSGGALLLKLNFKNEGDKTIRFLYSFLDVTDDRGRALSANSEDLPAELPPDAKTLSGTLSIPTALLDDVKKLSLNLTDYPDQQLQLQMSNIPVSDIPLDR